MFLHKKTPSELKNVDFVETPYRKLNQFLLKITKDFDISLKSIYAT